MKVTLSDIAEATGFSVSTISRVLRGEGNTSEANEQAILTKAKELNYPLQQYISEKRRQKGMFVALIGGVHPGEFYTSFFGGFVKAGIGEGIDVSMFNAPSGVDGLIELINKLQASGYSSAVLMVPSLHRQDYQKILKKVPLSFPLISCSNITHPVMDTITFNGYRGASLVAEHFISRGYTRFGFISGPSKKPEALYRKNGFVDAIKNSFEGEVCWVFNGDYSPELGQEAFHDYNRLKEKPRAVFAANDASAFGFMEAARADGYRFPENIALAGYDDLPQSELHYPSLTSVRTSYKTLAKTVLEDLMERQNSTKSHQGTVSLMTVDLIVRQTS